MLDGVIGRRLVAKARARVSSRLLCHALSQEVEASLLASSGKLDQELLFRLIEQRDALAKACTRVAAYLFTTLAILSIVMFGQTDEFSFLGIKIKDHRFFVFAALLVGNLLYVVSTGLFVKGLAYEFLLQKLAAKDNFGMGVPATGFLASHPGNILTFVTSTAVFARLSTASQALIRSTDVYMKYIIIFCYGLFFYSMLFTFLYMLWNTQPEGNQSWMFPHGTFFCILIALNIMTAVTSFTIFLPVPETLAGASLRGDEALQIGGGGEQLPAQFTLDDPRTEERG